MTPPAPGTAPVAAVRESRGQRPGPAPRVAEPGRVGGVGLRGYDARACADHDPELFFSSAASDQRAAVEVCTTCPIQRQCLEVALLVESTGGTRGRGEPSWGVWGAMTDTERRALIDDRRTRAGTGPGGGSALRRRRRPPAISTGTRPRPAGQQPGTNEVTAA